MNDTATIQGIALNPEFITFTNTDDLRAHIMGEETDPIDELLNELFCDRTPEEVAQDQADLEARTLANKRADRIRQGLAVPADEGAPIYDCSRCDGWGRLSRYNHIAGGVCFRCDGTGMAG